MRESILRDRGLQALLTGTALLYVLGFMADVPIRWIPSGLAVVVVLLFIPITGGVIGGYIFWREPYSFVEVARVLWDSLAEDDFLEIMADEGIEEQRQAALEDLRAKIDGEGVWWRRWSYLGFLSLVFGSVISMAVLVLVLLAGLALPILSAYGFEIAVLLVTVGLLWLVYYGATRRFDIGPEEASMATRIEEAATPIRWLFRFEWVGYGLRGFLSTFAVIYGGLGSLLFLGIISVIYYATGLNVAIRVFSLLVGASAGEPDFISLVDVFEGIAILSIGIYSMYLWYLLLGRLPHWLDRYPHGGPRPVETRRLPRYAVIVYPVLMGGFAGAVLLSPGETTGMPRGLVIVGFGLFALGAVAALYDGYRTARPMTQPANRVVADNYRILWFGFVLSGAMMGLPGSLPAWLGATSTAIGIALFYFLPDAGRVIDARFETLRGKKVAVMLYLVLWFVLVLAGLI